MENRIVFREMLTEIKEKADKAAGVITKEEIRSMLQHMPLEESHYQLIYEYLQQQSVRVVDSLDELNEYPEDEAQKSLTIYAQEMMELEGKVKEDEHALMLKILAGDQAAKHELLELYLPIICEMASNHAGEGNILTEDLIQEGNIGLLEALEQLEGMESVAEAHAFLFNSINEAMSQALSEDTDTNKKNQGIVSKVNHLNEAVNNLEEELGHKVSADELSAYLEMPLQEIEDLLRMSGDQIELDD